jgi:putative endopeptidase
VEKSFVEGQGPPRSNLEDLSGQRGVAQRELDELQPRLPDLIASFSRALEDPGLDAQIRWHATEALCFHFAALGDWDSVAQQLLNHPIPVVPLLAAGLVIGIASGDALVADCLHAPRPARLFLQEEVAKLRRREMQGLLARTLRTLRTEARMRANRILLPGSLALVACATAALPPAAPAPSPATDESARAAATAALARQKGIEAGDLDRSVDPCTDFFQYANGSWRAQNPIPPSMPRWSRRWAAGEANKDHLKAILDEVAAKSDWPKGSPERLIGDFYSSCMDVAKVDAAGVTGLQPLLAEIGAIESAADVQRTVARLHEIGVGALFGLASMPDLHDPTQVVADLSAGGLGLPDRDYYVKTEPRFVEARAKYQQYLAALFSLAGQNAQEAKAAGAAVLEFETSLAKATLDLVAQRDPKNLDHKTTVADLRKLAPHYDWNRYLDSAGLQVQDLNVREPRFVQEVDALIASARIAVWKAYLTGRLLDSAADMLSAPFAAESFGFKEAYLGGAKEMKPRWKRCAEETDALFGEALGRKYVERYFPPEAKARMQELVKNVLLAMGDSIEALTWMGPKTKARALEKLATFNPKIGYPDKWKDYSSVAVSRAALWPNVAAGRRFLVADDRSLIGKPVDRTRWGMSPPTSDAYYNPLLNEIVFPAGILQPPAFSVDATDAVNYGAIGVVIGHEVSHGFDDEGAQFDAQGRLSNWWTATDLQEFQKRGQCVVDQFEGYFVEPGLHHNGKLVLGESIGDLAGARIAWLAWRRSQAGKPPAPAIDGFTPEQQFFIAWGQFRGDAVRPETQRLMVQGDPHPIGKYRVIGPLSNLTDFARVFGCRPDAPMVRPPAQRCEIW